MPIVVPCWNSKFFFLLPKAPMEELGVGVGLEAKEVWVTKELVENCKPLVDKMNRTAGDRGLYKYEIET